MFVKIYIAIWSIPDLYTFWFVFSQWCIFRLLCSHNCVCSLYIFFSFTFTYNFLKFTDLRSYPRISFFLITVTLHKVLGDQWILKSVVSRLVLEFIRGKRLLPYFLLLAAGLCITHFLLRKRPPIFSITFEHSYN